ncbi:hypothetical protein DASC09_029610 [Saccharomycopsis crataegensis]|uniref:Uncharacterized protein n=1 Tax=Saccharomycopsis crataegensis TaxID=43959 RepID=A0AAV5QLR8_9ASCO|nr:hypothetical protein DASC09_029610 [Saccharomycopsis crataegensis]
MKFQNTVLQGICNFLEEFDEGCRDISEICFKGPENLAVLPDISIEYGEKYQRVCFCLSFEIKNYGLHKVIHNGVIESQSIIREAVINMVNASHDFFVISDFFTTIIFMLKDDFNDVGLQTQAREIKKKTGSKWRKVCNRRRKMTSLYKTITKEQYIHDKKNSMGKKDKWQKLQHEVENLTSEVRKIPIKISYRIFKNDDRKLSLILALTSLIYHCGNYSDEQIENATLKTDRLRRILKKSTKETERIKSNKV